MKRDARRKRIAIAALFGTFFAANPAVAAEDRWGRWVPADQGLTAADMRFGLHVIHLSLKDSSVGDGKRGIDYGFRRPAAYVPELTFSAFTSRHFSAGVMLQPASFGAQDAPVTVSGESHTRSPFILGIGAVVEGGWSFGPILLRPGIATGPRGVLLIQDRSGKQSPPGTFQWFFQARAAAEVEVTRSFAIGVGASTDVLRPLDWGAFGYMSWRFNDVAGAT